MICGVADKDSPTANQTHAKTYLVHLLARAFYATKNTTIPVALSILGFGIAIFLIVAPLRYKNAYD